MWVGKGVYFGQGKVERREMTKPKYEKKSNQMSQPDVLYQILLSEFRLAVLHAVCSNLWRRRCLLTNSLHSNAELWLVESRIVKCHQWCFYNT